MIMRGKNVQRGAGYWLMRRGLTPKRSRQHSIGLVPIALNEHETVEIGDLAELYMHEGIIPVSKRDDAMHVAICTALEFDVLLSWNFQHLANVKKQIRINVVNQGQGYMKPLLLLTPLEVMGDETEGE